MAEPVSLASGLLTLVVFAIQSSRTLYSTIKSFHIHPKRIRELSQELETLGQVLDLLANNDNSSDDMTLRGLELPLLRCGRACKEFEQELLKCSSRSGAGRTSFRDWAKLKYMGDDVDGFRQLLAGYKSTINIALTNANIRKTGATAKELESHKRLITNATNDLEAHLDDIDGKLEAVLSRHAPITASDTAELRMIEEERASTKKCLEICANLASHINSISPVAGTRSQNVSHESPYDTNPEKLMDQGLQGCKNSLAVTAAKLEKHMRDLLDRLILKAQQTSSSEEQGADLVRLREEWETARQCIDICSKADQYLVDSVSRIENYATGDEAVQFLVSTEGKTIHGQNRGYGWRARQIGGHLNDASLQQLSRDIASISRSEAGSQSTGQMPDLVSSLDAPNPDPSDSDFNEKFGRGFKLAS